MITGIKRALKSRRRYVHFVTLGAYTYVPTRKTPAFQRQNTALDPTIPKLLSECKKSIALPHNRIFGAEPGHFSQTLEPSAVRGNNPERSPQRQAHPLLPSRAIQKKNRGKLHKSVAGLEPTSAAR